MHLSNKHNRYSGLTLLELVIVSVILGVLLTYSASSYRVYRVRSRLTQAIVFLPKLTSLIADYYSFVGDYPNNLAAIGLAFDSYNSEYTQGISLTRVGNGNLVLIDINVTTTGLSQLAANIVVGFRVDDSAIRLRCGQLDGSQATDVAVELLPESCSHTNVNSFLTIADISGV